VAEHLQTVEMTCFWALAQHRSNSRANTCANPDFRKGSALSLSSGRMLDIEWFTISGLRPKLSVTAVAAIVPRMLTTPTSTAPRIGDFSPASANTCSSGGRHASANAHYAHDLIITATVARAL
jgi:hypothetical protein